jgi:hypothetical protein
VTEAKTATARREARAEDNQRYVRDKLSQRDPAFARDLEAAIRERGGHLDARPQRVRGGRTR